MTFSSFFVLAIDSTYQSFCIYPGAQTRGHTLYIQYHCTFCSLGTLYCRHLVVSREAEYGRKGRGSKRDKRIKYLAVNYSKLSRPASLCVPPSLCGVAQIGTIMFNPVILIVCGGDYVKALQN